MATISLTLTLTQSLGTITLPTRDILLIYPDLSASGAVVIAVQNGIKKTYTVTDTIEDISNTLGVDSLLFPFSSDREDFIYNGTAQSATNTTIVLAATTTLDDDALNGKFVYIYSGTGAGQIRQITDYVGSTDTCTVGTWATNPDNTSKYGILNNKLVIQQGLAQSGGATTVVIEALTALADDALNGYYVMIVNGTGKGQIRRISDYTGATDTVTVSAAWDTNPAAGSEYIILSAPQLLSADAVELVDDTNCKIQLDLLDTGNVVKNFPCSLTGIKAMIDVALA